MFASCKPLPPSAFFAAARLPRRPLQTRFNARRVAASAQDGNESPIPPPVWEHVLVAIIDANPALSTASRGALATAASLANRHRLTVLFLDDESGEKTDEKTAERVRLVRGQLEEVGLREVSFLEEALDVANSGQGSVAVGEAADGVGADLVVLASAAVHAKSVDANLLSEFVSAPLLLLP